MKWTLIVGVGLAFLWGIYLAGEEEDARRHAFAIECAAMGGVTIEARIKNGPKGQTRYGEPICIDKDAIK